MENADATINIPSLNDKKKRGNINVMDCGCIEKALLMRVIFLGWSLSFVLAGRNKTDRRRLS